MTCVKEKLTGKVSVTPQALETLNSLEKEKARKVPEKSDTQDDMLKKCMSNNGMIIWK